MKRLITTICAACALLTAAADSTLINEGWQFRLEGEKWQPVQVPHDWAFTNGYSEDGAQKDRGGYAMGGVGYYTREIEISKSDLRSGKIFIDFDGVYMNSEVWCNDQYLGKRPYGYIPFSYEITPMLKSGTNTLKVRVDNSLEPSARWYHGCGIYGDVHIRQVGDNYFEKDGTYITTKGDEVAISTEIIAKKSTKKSLTLKIYDQNGKVIISERKKVALKEGLNNIDLAATINNAKQWSPESPYLYRVELELGKERVIDNLGFRTIEWSAAKGFFLNGKQYKLRGVCEHMEGGPTGAITNEEIMRWRLQQLKDMGCNAVRTAHNPYTTIFYELCDQIGLLVLDEAFDGWSKKAQEDYGAHAFDEWWQRDLTAFIRRDRNHPSIFLWSVGNETHGDVAPELVALCRKLDPSREVTSGDSNAPDMTVYGMNGRSESTEFVNWWENAGFNKPFIATENPHTWQVRGYYRALTWYRNGYPNDKLKPHFIPNLSEDEVFTYDWIKPSERRNAKQVFNSSYDNATVRVTARHLIEQLRDIDWFSGSFRWTGYDYAGEAGFVHGGWPFRASLSGALDLAGFKKDLYYLYQSEWGNEDMVHILPHWTHPAMEIGTKIPVVAYTSADEVELFLNGKSLGRKSKGTSWEQMQIEWLVPWTEGTISAVAYRDGEQVATCEQRSAGAPSKIVMHKYEDRSLRSDKTDVAIVSFAEQDAAGTLYPYGENRLYTKLLGNVKTLSFESGNPVDCATNYMADSRRFFFGLNRMFIQSTGAGDASLIAGAIVGDKKLMLSNRVSICVDEYALRGTLHKHKFDIRYSINGGEMQPYTAPFTIEQGTTIRAQVFVGEELMLDMSETFSQEDGLYWGKVGEPVCNFTGEQAEIATLSGAKSTQRYKGDLADGYYGDGFVEFSAAGDSVSWYQENDGAPFEAEMTIRYSQDVESTTMALYNDAEFIGNVEFKSTGAIASLWADAKVKLMMKSGGNNITLKALSGHNPLVDQAEFK